MLANIEFGFVSNLIPPFVRNLPPLFYLAYFRCLERYWPGPSSAARETSWLQGFISDVKSMKERVGVSLHKGLGDLFSPALLCAKSVNLELCRCKIKIHQTNPSLMYQLKTVLAFNLDCHSLHSTKAAVKSFNKWCVPRKTSKSEPSGLTVLPWFLIFSSQGNPGWMTWVGSTRIALKTRNSTIRLTSAETWSHEVVSWSFGVSKKLKCHEVIKFLMNFVKIDVNWCQCKILRTTPVCCKICKSLGRVVIRPQFEKPC